MPQRKIKNDPAKKIDEKDLALQFPWTSSAGERVPTQVVSFRVQPKYIAMLENLRTNPASPYYGLFPTQDDLERHLYIHSVLAVHNSLKGKLPPVQDIILKERLAAQQAFYAQHRETMRKNVESLMFGIEQHLIAGSPEMAAESLDGFVQVIMDMDEVWRKEYATAILNSKTITSNWDRLSKLSVFLTALDEEYSP